MIRVALLSDTNVAMVLLRALKHVMMVILIMEMDEVTLVQLNLTGLEILTIHQSDRNVVME